MIKGILNQRKKLLLNSLGRSSYLNENLYFDSFKQLKYMDLIFKTDCTVPVRETGLQVQSSTFWILFQILSETVDNFKYPTFGPTHE